MQKLSWIIQVNPLSSPGACRRRWSKSDKGNGMMEAEVGVMHFEGAATGQVKGHSRPPEAGEGKEMDPSLKSPEEKEPYQHLDFSLRRFISDF